VPVVTPERAQRPGPAPTAQARSSRPPRPRGGGRLGQDGVFAGLAVGAFLGPLDGSIVSSMLPILTRELGVEIAAAEWLLTIDTLIQAGLMLTLSRPGDLRGHKPIYVGGLVVLLAGSVPSSLALLGAMAVRWRRRLDRPGLDWSSALADSPRDRRRRPDVRRRAFPLRADSAA
jgi:hypothetical protein